MSNQQKRLKINSRSEFVKYLDSFSKINDSFIADVKTDNISAIAASSDNTLVLYGEYECESNYQTSLNIPDSKKLVRVLDTIDSESIDLILNNNNIEYRGTSVKFKYHLFEDGFLNKPSLSIEKIKKFNFDITFNLTKQLIQTITKGSSFTTETNKLYFYTEDNTLKAELTDKARHNTDSYVLSLCEVDFTLAPIAVNFDNIRLLTLLDNSIDVNINTQYGVLVFSSKNSKTKLSYIISSLTQ
jgi:hypothetical protein